MRQELDKDVRLVRRSGSPVSGEPRANGTVSDRRGRLFGRATAASAREHNGDCGSGNGSTPSGWPVKRRLCRAAEGPICSMFPGMRKPPCSPSAAPLPQADVVEPVLLRPLPRWSRAQLPDRRSGCSVCHSRPSADCRAGTRQRRARSFDATSLRRRLGLRHGAASRMTTWVLRSASQGADPIRTGVPP